MESLKKICASEGLEAHSPRSTFQHAYALKLIDDETTWLEMMESRNLSPHTYRFPIAHAVYTQCHRYLPVMQAVYAGIADRFGLK